MHFSLPPQKLTEKIDLAWLKVEIRFFSLISCFCFWQPNYKRPIKSQMTKYVAQCDLHMCAKCGYCSSHRQGAAAVSVISRIFSPFSQCCHSSFSTARGRKELKLGYRVSDYKPIQHAKFHSYVIKGTAPKSHLKLDFALTFICR